MPSPQCLPAPPPTSPLTLSCHYPSSTAAPIIQRFHHATLCPSGSDYLPQEALLLQLHQLTSGEKFDPHTLSPPLTHKHTHSFSSSFSCIIFSVCWCVWVLLEFRPAVVIKSADTIGSVSPLLCSSIPEEGGGRWGGGARGRNDGGRRDSQPIAGLPPLWKNVCQSGGRFLHWFAQVNTHTHTRQKHQGSTSSSVPLGAPDHRLNHETLDDSQTCACVCAARACECV